MSGFFALFGLEEWAGIALQRHAKARGMTVGLLAAEVLAAEVLVEWLRREPEPDEEDDEE